MFSFHYFRFSFFHIFTLCVFSLVYHGTSSCWSFCPLTSLSHPDPSSIFNNVWQLHFQLTPFFQSITNLANPNNLQFSNFTHFYHLPALPSHVHLPFLFKLGCMSNRTLKSANWDVVIETQGHRCCCCCRCHYRTNRTNRKKNKRTQQTNNHSKRTNKSINEQTNETI